jgi:hypothetical protein
MPWKIVERRIGRAGGPKQRAQRQREWDRRYGEDLWAIGYIIDGEFVHQEQALDTVYYRSYEAHFETHPDDLDELVTVAKTLRNPHGLARAEHSPQPADDRLRRRAQSHARAVLAAAKGARRVDVDRFRRLWLSTLIYARSNEPRAQPLRRAEARRHSPSREW